MAKVIEFYIPEELSETVKDGCSAATRKNHRVLPADEEISLAAIHLLRIERKYDVHSHTSRLYASGRFRKTVASHLPKLSQPGTVPFPRHVSNRLPRAARTYLNEERISLC